MKNKLKLAVSGLLMMVASSAATAGVLTFDSITDEIYGTDYTEAGFTFSLNDGLNEHIGDGHSTLSQLLEWHNGGDNNADAVITMTKIGGGLFNLHQMDILIQGATDLLVNGSAYGAGTHSVNLLGVSSVTFDWTFTSASRDTGGIDNLHVSEVSEPGALALLSLGIAAVMMRRRKKVRLLSA